MTGQADIDEDTRKALALSAARRLGSSGSSAGQSTAGSGKMGAWQEALDGSATEQVAGSLACYIFERRHLCTHTAHALHEVARAVLGAQSSYQPEKGTCWQGSCKELEVGAGLQDLCKAEEGQRGLPAHVGSMEVDGPPSGLPAGEANLHSASLSHSWHALHSRCAQQSASPCQLIVLLRPLSMFLYNAVKLGPGGGCEQQGENSARHADVSTPHDQHHNDIEAKEPPAWRQVGCHGSLA